MAGWAAVLPENMRAWQGLIAAGKAVPTVRYAARNGTGPALPSLRCLEALEFIRCEGGVLMATRIIVRDVPPRLPEGARRTAAVIGEKIQERPEVFQFLTHWARLCGSATGVVYDEVSGRDIGIVKRMLATHSLDELRTLASFFWAHKQDNEVGTIPHFKSILAEVQNAKFLWDETVDDGP